MVAEREAMVAVAEQVGCSELTTFVRAAVAGVRIPMCRVYRQPLRSVCWRKHET